MTLDHSKNNRIILLHREPEKTIKTKSRSAMWHRYDSLVSSGQIVHVNKWFSQTDIDEILPIIMGS